MDGEFVHVAGIQIANRAHLSLLGNRFHRHRVIQHLHQDLITRLQVLNSLLQQRGTDRNCIHGSARVRAHRRRIRLKETNAIDLANLVIAQNLKGERVLDIHMFNLQITHTHSHSLSS